MSARSPLPSSSALRERAADRPLLVAVDDVQWLDSPSAAVLAFAWRRLREEPGWPPRRASPGHSAPAALVEHEGARPLEVAPLSLGAIHGLLQARLGLGLPRPTLRRLHDVAGGNPFYALELGRALQRSGATPAPGEPLPVPQNLRELVRDRLVVLPASTRDALAVAAALSQPTLTLLRDAGHEADALQPAAEAHVLEVHGDRSPLHAPAARLRGVRERRRHRTTGAPPPTCRRRRRRGGAVAPPCARRRHAGRGCRGRPRARCGTCSRSWSERGRGGARRAGTPADAAGCARRHPSPDGRRRALLLRCRRPRASDRAAGGGSGCRTTRERACGGVSGPLAAAPVRRRPAAGRRAGPAGARRGRAG